MSCKECISKPAIVLKENNRKLCKKHFIEYFEKKAYRTISSYSMISKKDKIAVAVSGGKDSISCLYILNKLCKRMRIPCEAILINEGIRGYRDNTIKDAKKFCTLNNIELHIFSFEKEFKMPLDKMIKKMGKKPCSICGVFRRFLLNKKAKELGFTKLATGHNLDDECQSIIMNQFRSNMETSARLGPITGIVKDKKFITRIKPFYFLTEKETAAYAFLMGFPVSFNECPYVNQSFRGDIRDMLNDFEAGHPGIKHNIVKSFIEILPELKKKYAKTTKSYCSICGEPATGKICKACQLIEVIE